MPRRVAPAAILALCLASASLLACRDEPPPSGPLRPNVLWVVWDTVRADRLGLYGYAKATTPRLDLWARDARVFDNAISTAGYTIPAHASFFTGLLPSEHCAYNGFERLDDSFVTLAEQLQGAGYRTFLYSENPNISSDPARNFGQGFDQVLHPWSPEYAARARAIVERKLPDEDRSSELRARLTQGSPGPWTLKAAGELGQEALLDWLADSAADKPWFAFLNYMEAHRPLIPPRRHREALMNPTEVERSYRVDRGWLRIWEYVFRLREIPDEDLATMGSVYDAALLELDELFAELLAALEREDALRDTVVILTADHGEHLGEAHLLDHQYSLHDALLRVPLVVRHPAHFAPGRDASPVMNFDLHPTVLEITGLPSGVSGRSSAQSLLRPLAARDRLSEEPGLPDIGMADVRAAHPDWDPAPFRQRQRAWTDRSGWKYVWRSKGPSSLFDLNSDPRELRDQIDAEEERALSLSASLSAYRHTRALCEPAASAAPPTALSAEQRERLRALGYLPEGPATARPAPAAEPDSTSAPSQ